MVSRTACDARPVFSRIRLRCACPVVSRTACGARAPGLAAPLAVRAPRLAASASGARAPRLAAFACGARALVSRTACGARAPWLAAAHPSRMYTPAQGLFPWARRTREKLLRRPARWPLPLSRGSPPALRTSASGVYPGIIEQHFGHRDGEQSVTPTPNSQLLIPAATARAVIPAVATYTSAQGLFPWARRTREKFLRRPALVAAPTLGGGHPARQDYPCPP